MRTLAPLTGTSIRPQAECRSSSQWQGVRAVLEASFPAAFRNLTPIRGIIGCDGYKDRNRLVRDRAARYHPRTQKLNRIQAITRTAAATRTTPLAQTQRCRTVQGVKAELGSQELTGLIVSSIPTSIYTDWYASTLLRRSTRKQVTFCRAGRFRAFGGYPAGSR